MNIFEIPNSQNLKNCTRDNRENAVAPPGSTIVLLSDRFQSIPGVNCNGLLKKNIKQYCVQKKVGSSFRKKSKNFGGRIFFENFWIRDFFENRPNFFWRNIFCYFFYNPSQLTPGIDWNRSQVNRIAHLQETLFLIFFSFFSENYKK